MNKSRLSFWFLLQKSSAALSCLLVGWWLWGLILAATSEVRIVELTIRKPENLTVENQQLPGTDVGPEHPQEAAVLLPSIRVAAGEEFLLAVNTSPQFYALPAAVKSRVEWNVFALYGTNQWLRPDTTSAMKGAEQAFFLPEEPGVFLLAVSLPHVSLAKLHGATNDRFERHIRASNPWTYRLLLVTVAAEGASSSEPLKHTDGFRPVIPLRNPDSWGGRLPLAPPIAPAESSYPDLSMTRRGLEQSEGAARDAQNRGAIAPPENTLPVEDTVTRIPSFESPAPREETAPQMSVGVLPDMDLGISTNNFASLSVTDWDQLVSRYSMPLYLRLTREGGDAPDQAFLLLPDGTQKWSPIPEIEEQYGLKFMPFDLLPLSIQHQIANRLDKDQLLTQSPQQGFLLSQLLVDIAVAGARYSDLTLDRLSEIALIRAQISLSRDDGTPSFRILVESVDMKDAL